MITTFYIYVDGSDLVDIAVDVRTRIEIFVEPYQGRVRIVDHAHWLALIDGIARRLALPWKMDDRLDALWAEVAGDLAASWTLTGLANRAGFSTEHLRRLCLKTLGRTPMDHVAFMRMQHACALLSGSDDKVDYIARVVGYATGHAFSRAFQRSVGLAPSEFRARR